MEIDEQFLTVVFNHPLIVEYKLNLDIIKIKMLILEWEILLLNQHIKI